MTALLTCPACRATGHTGLQCRRCRADLSLLAAVLARRDHEQVLARAAATEQDWPTAKARAAEAVALGGGEEAFRWLALACLMTRDFAGAIALHDRLRNRSTP